jgi:predicted MPP superfamily phosphohydrolase
VFKYLGNLTSVLGTPGWFISVRIYNRMHPESMTFAVISYGLAWAMWLGLAALILRLRAWAAGERPVTSEDEPEGERGLSRRALIANSAIALPAMAAGGTVAHGTLIAPWQLATTRYTIDIKDLPEGHDGLRIAFIADTHLGPRVPDEFLRDALQTAVDLKPDLFILGGDYVHNGVGQVPRAAQMFAEMLVATGKPVIGVLGNHDWYASGSLSKQELTKAGVLLVDNARVSVRPDRSVTRWDEPGPRLVIAGVGDLWTDWVDAVAALDTVPKEVPRILLSHNPDVAEPMTPMHKPIGFHRVDLMLSGHTHGGQVSVPILGRPVVPSQYHQKYAYGLVQGPSFPVLITSGVGMSLIPIRIGCPPEVVEITLRVKRA